MRHLTLTVLSLAFLAINFACHNDTIEPSNSDIQLSSVDIGVTEVWLRVRIAESSTQRAFTLDRDGRTILTILNAPLDTIVHDESLLPKHQYLYRASLPFTGLQIGEGSSVTITTMDTTNHNFGWDIQTIGVFQSSLSDVWGNSASDVWAVGSISDTLTGFSPNATHFDGVRWSLVQIREGFQIFGIFGFGANDIFAVSLDGIVYHWDGTMWRLQVCLGIGDGCTGLLGAVQLTAVWGISANDLFAVGDSGAIVHFDGQSWTKMESGTILTLQDVWGSSSTNVYAVGMDFFSARWIVLHYDGKNWRTEVVDPIKLNRPAGIWGTGENNIYIASDFVYRFNGLRWQKLEIPNTLYNMGGVEGSARNNVLVVGSFGVVLHWNGISWRQYDELLQPQGGRLLRRAWTKGNDVYIVGAGDSAGIIIHGRRF